MRKNIHHTGKSLPKLVSNGVQVTGQYSRHGAIAAQQTHGPQTLSTKDALSKGGVCVCVCWGGGEDQCQPHMDSLIPKSCQLFMFDSRPILLSFPNHFGLIPDRSRPTIGHSSLLHGPFQPNS